MGSYSAKSLLNDLCKQHNYYPSGLSCTTCHTTYCPMCESELIQPDQSYHYTPYTPYLQLDGRIGVTCGYCGYGEL